MQLGADSLTFVWLLSVTLSATGCGADDNTAAATASVTDPAWAFNEEWLDSCRRWCGTQATLSSDCVAGEARVRGVRLGEPLPPAAPKSYDLSCLDECMSARGPETQCWQQSAQANDCYAADAVFICDGLGGWEVIGCETAGLDPTLCKSRRETPADSSLLRGRPVRGDG